MLSNADIFKSLIKDYGQVNRAKVSVQFSIIIVIISTSAVIQEVNVVMIVVDKSMGGGVGA